MNRKTLPILIAWAAGALLASAARSAPIVVLDLDGIPGDGPDRVSVETGGWLAVDVWFEGGDPLVAWGVVLCDPSGVLSFADVLYHTSSPWENIEPDRSTPGCVALASSNKFFGAVPLPWLVATVTFRAPAEPASADLVVDEQNSGWLAPTLRHGPLSGSVGAAVDIESPPPPPPPPPSWSGIKSLFR